MFKRTSYKNGKEVSNVEGSDGNVSALAIQEVLQQFIASGKVQQNEEVPTIMLEEMNREIPKALARINKQLAEEKESETIEVEVNSNSMVKYSNNIDLKGIGALTKLEHDVFTAIILAIRQSKTNKVKVPLSSFKKIIHYETKNIQETVEILNSIAKKFLATMVYQEYFYKGSKREVGEVKGTLLFNQYTLHWDEEETYLYFELPHNVERIFFDIQESFTQIMAEDLLNLKTKYAKSLCHLLSRNFKGCFRIKTAEFKDRLGFPKSYQQCGILRELNKAIKTLIDSHMFKEINYKCKYGSGKGRPVIEYIFDYQFTEEYEAKLHGQAKLDGIEDEPIVDVPANIVEPKEQPTHVNKDSAKPKLLKGTRCNECGAPLYYKECLNEGEHQGEYQVFCNNNKFYKAIYKLAGNGTCTWNQYYEPTVFEKLKAKANEKRYSKDEVNNILKNSNLSSKVKQYLIKSEIEIRQFWNLQNNIVDGITLEKILDEKRKLGIPEHGLKLKED